MYRVLKQLTLEFIVLETDAQDITSASHPGERNSPENLPAICSRLAEIRGISTGQMAEATTRNAQRLYQWPETTASVAS